MSSTAEARDGTVGNTTDLGATLSRRAGRAAIAPATIAVIIFFLAPLLYFLRYSLETPTQAGFAKPTFSLDSFVTLFTQSYYTDAIVRTIVIALCSTLLTLILALPTAYMVAKSGPRAKSWLIIGCVFPLLVGSVIRSIGWAALLGYTGLVNKVLTVTRIIPEPIQLLQSPVTIAIAIASVVIPTMILILHSSMESVDPGTERAGLSLGARPGKVFWQISIPQIMPGIITGTSLVFVMCLNAYATPVLVGSSRVPMLAPIVYQSITVTNNWPLGAATATLLLAICLLVVILFGWLVRRRFERWRDAR
jgi:putative spermidine/putrescine transport system permease protein